ncbi:MAG: hypothetical protein ACXU9A_20980 [Xanthobacteraceae bacterium]
MSIELSRIELTGLGGAGSGRPEKSAAEYLRSGYVWLPAAALIAGMAAWALVAGYASRPAEGEPVLATAVVTEPAVSPASSVFAFDPPTAEGEAIVPEETAPVDGLRISSQYWRRGGLGRRPWLPSRSAIPTTMRSRISRSPAPSAARTAAI